MINKYGKDGVVQISIVFVPLNFQKGTLKQDFLEICLTTFFVVRNFRDTSAMRVVFYLKMIKI